MDEDEEIECTKIQDRYGRVYDLKCTDWKTGWRLILSDEGARVGEAKCTVGPGGLFIGDLHIFEPAGSQKQNWIARLGEILGWREKPQSYRRLGLGSEMLQYIVSRARQKGIKGIEGNFSAVDTGPNPKLPEWYRKRGFTIKSDSGGFYMDL